MKNPSRNIMNKLARSVLSLYSYDDNPDDISLDNILLQSVWPCREGLPSIVAQRLLGETLFGGGLLHIRFPVERLSLRGELPLRMIHTTPSTPRRRPTCWT